MHESLLYRQTDRRTLMRRAGLGLAGLAGAVLVGCSDEGPTAKKAGTADAMAKDAMAKDAMGKDAMAKDAMAKGTADAMAKGDTMAKGDAMVQHVDLGPAKRYELVNGWYQGRDTRYWDFGMASPVAASGAVTPAPIYAFASGTNPDGTPRLVSGQHNVIDVLPGQPGYSDLWQVMMVTVPAGYEVDSIRSKADIDARGLRATPANLLVNCPVVPQGSTLAGNKDLVQGWYRGQHVFYPDFGMNPAVAIPIWAFATGMNADGSPRLVAGQRNIIDSIPGQAGYSAFWRVHLVMVNPGYEANSIKSAAQVASSGLPVTQTPLVVNCPVESPRA